MRAIRELLIIAGAALAACGGATAPASSSSPASSSLPPLPSSSAFPASSSSEPNVAIDAPTALSTIADESSLFVPEPTLTALDAPQDQAALAAVREKRWLAAKRLFGRLVIGYPDRTRLLTQYNAVIAHIEGEQRDANNALAAASVQTLPTPPWVYTLVAPAPQEDVAIPLLKKRSEKANHITDDESWYGENQVHQPQYFIQPSGDLLYAPNVALSLSAVANPLLGFAYSEYQPSARFLPVDLPTSVPLRYGTLALRSAYASPGYTICVYGSDVIAVFEGAKTTLRALFDLQAFEHPPSNKHGNVVVGQASLTTAEGTTTGALTAGTDTIDESLDFAAARNGTLYVQHSYNGYTKDAAGQTGYVTAIEIATGKLLWRSAPRAGNKDTFVLDRGGLICAYGFTAEPRFLHVLDAATGAVKQTLSVRATPEVLIEKGDALLLRAYDTDYVYSVR